MSATFPDVPPWTQTEQESNTRRPSDFSLCSNNPGPTYARPRHSTLNTHADCMPSCSSVISFSLRWHRLGKAPLSVSSRLEGVCQNAVVEQGRNTPAQHNAPVRFQNPRNETLRWRHLLVFARFTPTEPSHHFLGSDWCYLANEYRIET